MQTRTAPRERIRYCAARLSTKDHVGAQDGLKQRSRMSTHIRSSRIARSGRCTVSAKVAVMIALSPMLTVVDASAQLCPATT